MSVKLPDDLITLKEAAEMVDKSVSTLRNYIRNSHITKHKIPPIKNTTPVMVSKKELLLFLGTDRPVQLTKKPKAKEKRKTAENKKEFSALKKEVEMLKEMRLLLEERISELKEAKKSSDANAETLRLSLERANEKNEALQSRIDSLMVYWTLPFWKRWSIESPTMMLEHKK